MEQAADRTERFPYADRAALRQALYDNLRPAERISVAKSATRYLMLDNPGGGYSGPFTFDRVPYLRRPMECLSADSGYVLVAVMGPSQSAKSTIGNAWLFAYTPIVSPADMLMLMPDKDGARRYSVQQIDRVIAASREIAARVVPGHGGDTIYSKQFKGCIFDLIWPVASLLRARPYPRVRIDDYDAVPEDIDGEGNALVLTSGRQTTFEGVEMTLVNSSPARGEDRGIEALVARGTDERWHVPCKRCRSFFALDYEKVFRFDPKGTPEDAAHTARVVCPWCECPHDGADKPGLMRAGAWVGAEQSIDADGVVQGELRGGSIASFRVDGLMGFASWPRLAEHHRQAEITFERTQDEEELKGFFNTKAGKNYSSRVGAAEPLAPQALMARVAASDFAKGEIPEGCAVLTAAVDVQARRFAVLVMGWGDGLESWIVDRFDIEAVGDQLVEPARYSEHWDTLIERVVRRAYALKGFPSIRVPILNVAIDTGGLEGVTDNAYKFFYRALQRGVPATSLMLVKGGNRPTGRTLPPPTIDAKRQLKGLPEAALFVPNVNRIKDSISHRLHRVEPGPGYVHLPNDMDEAHVAEIVAERRRNNLWELDPGRRNETLDLLVYNYAALLRHAGTDTGTGWVEKIAPWAMVPAFPEPVTAPARPLSPTKSEQTRATVVQRRRR